MIYIKSLLAALATDATAPPEIIEREARETTPRAISRAIQEGSDVMNVMSTVVIPRRIEVVRHPWREDESSGVGTPRRWHVARAHARMLPEGFQRSEDNLRKYNDDLAARRIFPLSPSDDEAIRNGSKSYIPPSERGDRRLGEVVSTRAKIGEGATKQIITENLPEPEQESPDES